MVREARFAWDDDRSLPQELTRRGWDWDDPDEEPPAPVRHRQPGRETGTRHSSPTRSTRHKHK